MPKDSNARINEQFVMIPVSELQTLTRLNASGRTIQCLIALRSFAWDGRTAFPSIKAIAERMGLTNKTYKQSVLASLKWLEDHGLIVRNDKRSKERFVITTNEERVGNSLPQKPSEGSESPNVSIPSNNNILNTPISPEGTRQRNRRFNKWEKRQRKWERKAKAAQEVLAEEQRIQKEEHDTMLAEWLIEHRQAQDKIIALNGTKILDEQVSLIMARMDYESRSEIWTYEPAPIHELGIEEHSMRYHIRKLHTLRNPYFNAFGFGNSLQQIIDWWEDNRGNITG